MTRVANVYAQALYDLARDEGLSAQILDEQFYCIINLVVNI